MSSEEKNIISTDKAPAAIGAYSQAVAAGGKVYISGQIPFTAAGELVSENVRKQTEQALKNLRAIARAADTDLSRAVKVTIFADDLENFQEINEVYRQYFQEQPPARAFVEVSRLPKDVKVEIEAIILQ